MLFNAKCARSHHVQMNLRCRGEHIAAQLIDIAREAPHEKPSTRREPPSLCEKKMNPHLCVGATQRRDDDKSPSTQDIEMEAK